jgi:hypothetical protein
MILDENQALQVLTNNLKVSKPIEISRKESEELFALTQGDKFLELLINKIEGIESPEKAIARKKYSRDIVHFFERLLRPVDNVYSATGGSKLYHIEDDKKKTTLLRKIGRTRDGKTLQEWLRDIWMPLYHADPNGVIFIEYSTQGDEPECWPTYKNIDHIRAYAPKGQLVDWILFEPRKVTINNNTVELWRLVDDKTDRLYKRDGESFILLEEFDGHVVTFEHPFGQVPALINSNIVKLKSHHRISPIDSVVELSREYARDQSIKTLYKKYNGFVTQWRYENQCSSCIGAKKDDEGNECKDCDGHGYYKSKDVTDIISLKIPEEGEVKITPEIAGFIAPPIEIWSQYNDELKNLYETAHQTHWGTMTGIVQGNVKTATEIILNSQPMIGQLNKYADTAEFMEGQITEWFANFLDESKDKNEKIASINYGRRYIIDPPDVILEKYEKSKEKGDNNVILDRLLNEYFTAKYRSDPEWLRTILLKAKVEPYIHLSIEQVNTIFGNVEAQRKVLFEDWWNTLKPDSLKKDAETLRKEFDAWFKAQTTAEPKEGEE